MPNSPSSSSTGSTVGPAATSAVLPEPGDQPRATARPGSAAAADELIARLADKQIDALIDEADVRPTPRDADADAAMELAMQAAEELSKIAGDLSRATDQLINADLDPDPDELPPEPDPTPETAARADASTDTTSARPPPAFDPAADLGAELAARPSDEESANQPNEASPLDAASGTDTIEGPAADARPGNLVIEEPAPETSPPAPPSFNPPARADVDRTAGLAEPEGEPASTLHSTAADLDNSAQAVARELAEDVRPVATTGESAPAPQALPSGAWWNVALRRAREVPAMCVQLVNLPAAPLTDTGREVMGAIAIVTLVNAMSLLLYLMVFG
jgi:hypothetical protein